MELYSYNGDVMLLGDLGHVDLWNRHSPRQNTFSCLRLFNLGNNIAVGTTLYEMQSEMAVFFCNYVQFDTNGNNAYLYKERAAK